MTSRTDIGNEGNQETSVTAPDPAKAAGAAPPSFAESAAATYHQELHRFLRRRVARSQDLGDVMQEVYLRMMRIEKSELVRKPLAYIYGVAAHVAAEFRIRLQKERVLFDSGAAEAATDDPRQFGEDEASGFAERQIEEALEQLSPNRLAVFLLERRDGLSHGEIAEKLGLSVHTIKKYSVEALVQIRASLEG
jgi:RNA polymerase sigma factor (sigma-70 family)